jgi:hypothetical protein
MHVPEIIQVKDVLAELEQEGVITKWELPYENLLTRRSAAIFFVTPAGAMDELPESITSRLDVYENFSYRLNAEKKLSKLDFRITFSREEKEKNEQLKAKVA